MPVVRTQPAVVGGVVGGEVGGQDAVAGRQVRRQVQAAAERAAIVKEGAPGDVDLRAAHAPATRQRPELSRELRHLVLLASLAVCHALSTSQR